MRARRSGVDRILPCRGHRRHDRVRGTACEESPIGRTTLTNSHQPFDGTPVLWNAIRGAAKPFAPACERNKGPILEVLRRVFAGAADVLEIGSGTGQHAVWFAAGLPHLTWRTSDLPCEHAGINAWIDDAGLANVERPLALDVARRPWPLASAGGAFSANTAHYMHWPEVESMFGGVAALLPPGAKFALYGPFARGGRHSSASNAVFDRMLRAHDPGFGVRDVRDLDGVAAEGAMALEEDVAMPSNNRILVWRKVPG